MLARCLPVVFSLLCFACTAGVPTTTSSSSSGGDDPFQKPAPTPTGSSTSATEPTPPKKPDGAGSALGPSCTEYIACCDGLADSNPQVAASCDSVQQQIESAQAKGVSTSSYESACKSGVASFKSAGYCK